MLTEDTTLLPLADAIDRDSTRIDDIDAEILAAHKQSGVDEHNNPVYDYTDLDDRFTSAETAIGTINSTLGSGFDTTTNTVAATITAAISTAAGDATTKANAAEQNAKTYLDNKIYNNLDQTTVGYVLDATQGKALDTRLTAAETKLTTVVTTDDLANLQVGSSTIVLNRNEVNFDNEGKPVSLKNNVTVIDTNDYLI